ncbi:MAG: hypothetical protein HPY54_04965 [Chthonomonadetes bacterium]|nr:hypothetical protein [Chthonomonadetes bacterium]
MQVWNQQLILDNERTVGGWLCGGMSAQQDRHWRHHRFGHVMRIRNS